MELPCIGYPLVDQNEAWPVLVEEFAQNVAGTRSLLVVGTDAIKSLLPAELPGELTPKSADHRAVRLPHGVTWRDLIPYQYYSLGCGQLFGFCFLQDSVNANQLTRGRAREEG